MAFMKKNGLDQWAPSDCSVCSFDRMQKNDAIIIIQLHGNQVDTLHPFTSCSLAPALPV